MPDPDLKRIAERICHDAVEGRTYLANEWVDLLDRVIAELRAVYHAAAAPCLALLTESKREHRRGDRGPSDAPSCSALGSGTCNCGADAWNTRIDDLLTAQKDS